MIFKNKRQVVIINDIKSDSIEQAIFILRDKNNEQRSDIVLEAERIINSFIGCGAAAVQQNTPKSRKGVIMSTLLWFGSAIAVVCISALILSFM